MLDHHFNDENKPEGLVAEKSHENVLWLVLVLTNNSAVDHVDQVH